MSELNSPFMWFTYKTSHGERSQIWGRDQICGRGQIWGRGVMVKEI